jgi:hypothetical protein
VRLRLAIAAPLLVLAPPVAIAAPGDMSVAAFLAKTDALKAKGMMAMMSGDIGVLREEVSASGLAYRARLAADKTAGRPPRACPPAKIGMKSEQLLTHLRGYPAAQRPRITIKAAMGDWIEKTYPCR